MKGRWLVLSALLLVSASAGLPPGALPAWRLGAQHGPGVAAPAGRPVAVASVADALRAIRQAKKGDVITFAPGTYRFDKMSYIDTGKAQGVTVRAASAGTVMLEFDMVEGFMVRSPGWTFENLGVRGACASHDQCEHAFHVVGGATGFVARNNTVTDFNAAFKINGSNGNYPDRGLIEHNTISNDTVRETSQSVTLIDLVGASGWMVRANVIADFIKGQGDGTSYGAFFKGAGSHNTFEGNAVLCEQRLRGKPGLRVGLSLGGGGTGAPYCRDQSCTTEQDQSVIAANLVMSCSDEGIYLNRAARSKVLHNTLLETAGMMARYASTSAAVEGNIVDGRIATSHDAALQLADNLVAGAIRVHAGSHPQRTLFAQPASMDLRWRGAVPRRTASGVPDLCGAARPSQPAYGAFEDFAACLDGKQAP